MRPSEVSEEDWVQCYKKMPRDGYKRRFIYRCPGGEGRDFDLISLGNDGKEGNDDDITNLSEDLDLES